MDKLWYLSQISLYEEMSKEEMVEIDQLETIHHFKRISKNTLVQTPDTAREGLFFVKEGKLKLYKLSDDGKQFTVSILTRGNMFGEFNTFSFGTKRIYIETMESTLLCSISEPQFEGLMVKRPRIALKILKVLSDLLKERDDQLEQLAFKGLRERLLHLLSTLCAKFSVVHDGYALIDLPLSQQEIANLLGATREAVSSVMSELAKEGIIKTSRMSVQLAVSMLEGNSP